MSRRRAYFGNVRKLPSGRYQARWRSGGRYLSAKNEQGRPLTFSTQRNARIWLDRHRDAILAGTWNAAPPEAPLTVESYAGSWLAARRLSEESRASYAGLLRKWVLPSLGHHGLCEVTPSVVRAWHAGLAGKAGEPTRATAYRVLKSILATAVDDDLLTANPCRIRGAGSAPTIHHYQPATLDQLAVLTAAMPDDLQALVQTTTWCSLRLGEVLALQRRDIDLERRLLRVERSVGPKDIIKQPKTNAGVRTVTIPPHLVPALAAHIERFAAPGRDGLVFPNPATGTYWNRGTIRHWFYKARTEAGRPDLRFHDLRHTGQTLAALSGASLRELMRRAGQVSPNAALRYIHQVDGRQEEIAQALSALLTVAHDPAVGSPVSIVR